jgi:type IV pilus assembly protein PilV
LIYWVYRDKSGMGTFHALTPLVMSTLVDRTKQGAKQAMRSEAGFTLLELLVAITILAIGLIATVNMQTTAIQGNSFAYRTTSASAVARAAMDELISRPGSDPFFDVALAAGTPYDLDPQTVATTLTVQNLTFSATIAITPNAAVNGPSIPNLTQIVLTVTGNDVTSFAPVRTITLTELKRAI